MKTWIGFCLLLALMTTAGCAAGRLPRAGEPAPAPPAVPAPAPAPAPAPSPAPAAPTPPAPAPTPPPAPAGPALGHVPVPRDRGGWAVTGPQADEVARLFALWPQTTCECREVTVAPVDRTPDRATFKVRLEGLFDDSLQDMEYLVTVRRSGETWQVESATYTTVCRRGATPEGLCI